MCQAVVSPNLTKKFQWEVSQIADNRFPCVMLLGGLSVNLNHLIIIINDTAARIGNRTQRDKIINSPPVFGKILKQHILSIPGCRFTHPLPGTARGGTTPALPSPTKKKGTSLCPDAKGSRRDPWVSSSSNHHTPRLQPSGTQLGLSVYRP